MEVFGRELTTEEIIRFVRDFAAQTRHHKDCHDCLYIDMALALADALESNRRAAPENKALTLEELRGMDGEPVWVVQDDVEPYWAIIWRVSSVGIHMRSAEDVDDYGSYDLYGKTWLVFARRPKAAP